MSDLPPRLRGPYPPRRNGEAPPATVAPAADATTPPPTVAPLADATTPKLGLTQPEIGASASTWGNKLNANFGILDNTLPLSGGALSGSLSVGGNGIQYTGMWPGHYFAFGWDGSNLYLGVDGTYIGNMATQNWVGGNYASIGWVEGNYMPLGGGSINGNLSVSGQLFGNEINLSGQFYGIEVNLSGPGNIFASLIQLNSDNAWKPSGGAWYASSDARIKDIAGDFTTGLAALLQLRPVHYRFKGNYDRHADIDTSKQHVGLVAQEAETVIPEMVWQTAGRIDGVEVGDVRQMDTSPLIFVLVNAVKELTAKVGQLAGRVRALEEASRGQTAEQR